MINRRCQQRIYITLQLALIVFEMKFSSYDLLQAAHRKDSRVDVLGPDGVNVASQSRQFRTNLAEAEGTTLASDTTVALTTGVPAFMM